MPQTTTYSMATFVDDVKHVFAASRDPLAQAEAVAGHMKELLAVPGWLEEQLNLPEEEGYGRFDLHQDDEAGHPGSGFLLMCSVQKPGQDNLPHDHGAAWVVYGVYEGAIKQTKWRWFYPGEGVDVPQIKESGSFVQHDGSVAFFLPGEIHQTENVAGGRSLVVRLESQRLNSVTRYQYDPANRTVKVMDR